MKQKYITGLFLLLLALPTLLTAQQETVVIPGIYRMPETAETVVKKVTKADVREDLHKFMGYEDLLTRYVSIPYDTSTNANFTDFFCDPGFLIILLLPILFLLSGNSFSPKKQLILNLSIMSLSVLLLIFSVSGAYMNKHHLQTPAEALVFLETGHSENAVASMSKSITVVALGLYQPFHSLVSSVSGSTDTVTYPVLMVLFTLLLWLFLQRISGHPITVQSLLIFTASYFFFWWILGSGMSWYGLLLFCLPYFFILNTLNKEALSLKNFKAIGVLSICVLWLLFAFVFRATNYSPTNLKRAQFMYIPPIIEYQTGNASKKQAMETSFPRVTELTRIINQNEKGRVYRVGTQMKFFINRNDERVFDDTFLSFFAQMVQTFKNKDKIIQELKANKFEFILLDLNMANSDFTPEKTLTKKFTNLLNTLYNNQGVELVLTDRTLKSADGKMVSGVFPANASIANPGRMALFRIK